ncbi:MAG: hypothetical protein QOI41_2797 [Myxococcales bacterium]|nr:hypothetical protein [Myxococcales bacterium]
MHAFAAETAAPERLAVAVAKHLAEEIGDACTVLLRSADGSALDAIAVEGADPSSAGVHSVLEVELRVHGEPIGLLSISRHRPDSPPFDEADRELAQTLADHAALAIANARSHVAERAARAAAESAVEALRIAEARFNRLSESGIIGILVSKRDGAIVEVNERVTSLIGYSRAELLSGAVRWTDLTPKELAHVDRRAVEQLASTGVAGVREKEYIHKDGHHVPVMVGTATIPGSDDHAISFILDLSERKRADKAVAEATTERALAARIGGLLDAAPDALVTTSQDGRIILVNSQAERLFGYAREELIGQPGEMLLAMRFRGKSDERSAFYRENANARSFGEGIEICGLRKDGTELPIELRLSPTVTPEGVLVTAAIRDVTERRKADEIRARLAAIVDSSHDAIIGETLDGIITSWNRGAERLFGYAASEAIGRPITLLVPEDRLDEQTVHLSQLREGEVRELETVRVRKDGTKIDVWITTSPVRDERGKLIGGSKIARDVSERKRNEGALLLAKEQAEMANRELEAFSYSVAHDLRAPLRGMNGFAQLLVTEYASKLDDEGRDWLEEILQNSQKMGALIDALLSMSRLTRAEIHKESVDLSTAARGIARELARDEPERSVDVVVVDGLHTRADPTLVHALLQNLLANAWKFTSRAASARIEVGGVRSAFGPAFFVRDNGAGFDMAFAKKLFTPFQRLHTPAEFPGTGIGLANVHRIVHRHGGRVWAEGCVGAGATFFFTLPESP